MNSHRDGGGRRRLTCHLTWEVQGTHTNACTSAVLKHSTGRVLMMRVTSMCSIHRQYVTAFANTCALNGQRSETSLAQVARVWSWLAPLHLRTSVIVPAMASADAAAWVPRRRLGSLALCSGRVRAS